MQAREDFRTVQGPLLCHTISCHAILQWRVKGMTAVNLCLLKKGSVFKETAEKVYHEKTLVLLKDNLNATDLKFSRRKVLN